MTPRKVSGLPMLWLVSSPENTPGIPFSSWKINFRLTFPPVEPGTGFVTPTSPPGLFQKNQSTLLGAVCAVVVVGMICMKKYIDRIVDPIGHVPTVPV